MVEESKAIQEEVKDTQEPESSKSNEEVHAVLSDIVSKGLHKLELDREGLKKEYEDLNQLCSDPSKIVENAPRMIEIAKKLKDYDKTEKVLTLRIKKAFDGILVDQNLGEEWAGDISQLKEIKFTP